MKRIKYLIIVVVILLTGCMNNNSMEGITVYTTSYPIEYVTNELYGNHSTIKSIYPNGVDINNYKITKTLINEYSDNDLYIFNGLTNEKEYVKDMRKNNKKLMIIDVTNDIKYDYSVEELWLDPAKLLGLANNIKKGLNEYIKNNPVLTNEINNNYNELKITLTDLESKYREELSSSSNKTIVVSDDMFLFLKNYGLDVISIDQDNTNYNNNLAEAKNLINSGYLKYIFIANNNDRERVEGLGVESFTLNTISNLTDDQRNSTDYVTMIEENLQSIKNQINVE